MENNKKLNTKEKASIIKLAKAENQHKAGKKLKVVECLNRNVAKVKLKAK